MNDLIDRHAAIECLDDDITITGEHNALVVQDYVRRVANKLRNLPSAEPEIIRCKNCKWYQTKYCVMDINMEGLTIFKAKENDYCSKAERRTDG